MDEVRSTRMELIPDLCKCHGVNWLLDPRYGSRRTLTTWILSSPVRSGFIFRPSLSPCRAVVREHFVLL